MLLWPKNRVGEVSVFRIAASVLASIVCFSPAWAATITQFTPQGTVAKVESVKLAFDKPVIAFGDGQAQPPMDVVCDDPGVKGQGRWLDAKRWTYAFDEAPGPGIHCKAAIKPSFRGLANETVAGKTSFAFQTGGPVIRASNPDGMKIAEDQVFVLRFNGGVDADSLVANSRCLVEGLGEAIPVRLISGEARRDILKATYYSMSKEWDTPATQLLQCKRLLPAQARVQLSVGPGVSTPAAPGRPGVASAKAEVLDYTVREPFKVSFSCMRENSSMPCTPLSALRLEFSAPIAPEDAKKIRLATPSGEREPAIDDTGYQGGLPYVRFEGPFPELASLSLVLPPGLKDEAGRELTNADQFPLAIRTAAFPPLAKFAAAPFGVIERFAYVPPGGSEADAPASVPLTLRSVEASLSTKDLTVSAGKVSDYATQDDVEVLRWYARLWRLDSGDWTADQLKDIMADRSPRQEEKPRLDVRGFSALGGMPDVRKLVLPGVGGENPRPFEVIGVPLAEPGFHVLEIESARLGQSLLASAEPMYVRSSALLTNLAVHIKTGRDDALAWVTTLDDGRVVPDAAITVLNCSGAVLAQGKTGPDGIWHHRERLDAPDYCEDTGLSGLYASARIAADHPLARGKADFSFVFSDWNRGIESWRFNVPVDTSPTPTLATHTVFDRTLLRAGETVSMKHFARVQTREGLALPSNVSELPAKLLIEHQGSDQRYEQVVSWEKTPSGGLSAVSTFAIPKAASLGMYSVTLADEQGTWYGSTQFRVEEFKLPVLSGKLKIIDEAGSGPLLAPASLDADVQISYVSGGPAGHLPVQISGVLRDRWVRFDDYEDYSFDPPEERENGESGQTRETGEAEQQTLFLDKRPLVLDGQGGGRLKIDKLPVFKRPAELLFEASFQDPNGQVQTLAQSVPVWPAGVQAGIRAGSWVAAGTDTRVHGLALSTAGAPQAGVPMTITATARLTYSTRKRLVGGFYSFDHHVKFRDLGTVCQGTTGANGVLECSIALKEAGAIQLRATASDAQGRSSTAESTVWVTGAGELWFAGGNDDRMDIIPERKSWKPGETATFQVHMPFRHATALVAVEREGVLKTQIVRLEGSDPTISIPIEADWGPNVYVSVLALRGRLHEVPWYSFFTWGWQQPKSWYGAFMDAGKNYAAPTPFIDLSKPSFRYGLTEIRVSDESDRLDVKVSADKPAYQVRERATVTVQVTTADGKPAAHGTVAFAAVDQALLELAPNNSWDLLSALRQLRSYGVQTATAQMEVVGRRHYGRKALPAGGGGGKSPTRELLNTLLLWDPAVQLDEHGKATLSVPLDDAITRYKLVAVADYGAQRFGTGSASIASTQDLQLIPGLPAVVREGDRYQALITARNSTALPMRVRVNAGYAGKGVAPEALAEREVELAPGAARSLAWDIQAPEGNLLDGPVQLEWRIEGRDVSVAGQTNAGGGASGTDAARDALVIRQELLPVVPVQTRQATLFALDPAAGPVRLPVQAPEGALTDANGVPRGGLQMHAQSSLAGGLPGVREWFSAYPYTCLEQLGSKAIGLRSIPEWEALMHRLPTYLDEDGLAGYFPGALQGNEVLTAYLLTVSHQAQALGLPYAIPEETRSAMTRGLLAFAQGSLARERWAPARDLDVRKLLALEALSRYGLVKARMLGSIAVAPDRWPTSAVIDWMALVQRVPGISGKQEKIAQASQILRARMMESGTGLTFGEDGLNDSWWLMSSRESNLAKLILLTAGQPEWRGDLPKMVQGLLGMQRRGAWRTTTANLMGSLAVEKFAQHEEATPVSGQLRLTSGSGVHAFDWNRAATRAGVNELDFLQPWASAKADTLVLEQQGQGRPWVSLRSLAAVPVARAVSAGYEIQRSVEPVSQAVPGVWSRGDVYRVTLTIQARTPTTWAALSDPIPAGATILGSGLGRDSSIAAQAGQPQGNEGYAPAFIERSFEAYRAYYDYLPAGRTTLRYVVRLNTSGSFDLPATRIEALYQPDVYGELPHQGTLNVLAGTQEE
jgi:uncharacterized protein YfaS (alpha-2-macroglobulin family)